MGLSMGKAGGRGLVGVGGGLVEAPEPARPWIRGFRGMFCRQGSEHLWGAKLAPVKSLPFKICTCSKISASLTLYGHL